MIFELSIRLIDGEQHDSWQWREGVGVEGLRKWTWMAVVSVGRREHKVTKW